MPIPPRVRSLVATLLTLWLAIVPASWAQAPAPAAADRLTALEERLSQLERTIDQRLGRLEQQVTQISTKTAAQPSAQEQAASRLLGEANAMIAAGQWEPARQKLAELTQSYGQTGAGRRARSLAAEVAVIGTAAPAKLVVEKWYQGEGEVSLTGGGPTLLVFWEEWCPHCRREVPKLTSLYTQYKDQGLSVVGLTKLTRSTTEEKLRAFITEQKIPYPLAKEDGQLSRLFHVSGIPAAAVVKGGKVVWRGHPAHITEAMIHSWL